MVMNMDEMISIYLDEQKATLWGRSWDLREPKSRPQAHDFIKALLADLQAIVKENA